MKKFEYKAIDFQKLLAPNCEEIDVNKLNALGNKGWELVRVDSGECIFKREVSS